MSNVFVYGTLMFPEVLNALLHRQPKAVKATVTGYRRHALKGQVFPATVPATTDSKVEGLVLFDLNPFEVDIFDEFEGDEYIKTPVKATFLGEHSEERGDIDVDMYVWVDRLRPMLKAEAWDPEAFRANHLQQYTVMCERFAAEYRAQAGSASSRPFTW